MSKAKRKVVVADFETDPFEFGKVPKPFCLGIWCDDFQKLYWGHDAIKVGVDFLKNNNFDVYFHNGGKFDIHFLLDECDLNKDIKIIHNRISKIKFGKSYLFDSYNIFPVPLSAMQKDEFDYMNMHESVRDQYREEISEYCLNDCKYLYERLKRFFDEFGKNLTLAGTAMKYYRNQQTEITGKAPNKSNEKYFEKFQPFYYGGRCECFRGGILKGPWKYYDINSAYPYAMTFPHPCSTKYNVFTKIRPQSLKKSFLHVQACSHGAFPWRTKTGLSFPNDKETRTIRDYYITGWELLSATKTKTVTNLKVIKQYVFQDVADMTRYVDDFYHMKAKAKKEKDETGYMFAKILMNALYGKFATNANKFKDYQIIDKSDARQAIADGWNLNSLITPRKQLVSRPARQSGGFYNVATGASITGFVRAMMWENIHASDTPIYCDTDSIICRDAPHIKLSEKLGDWDLEVDNIERAAIAGKKLYALELKEGKYKTASKGCRLDAKQILKIAGGETINYKFEAPTFSIKKEEVSFVEREIRSTL